MSPHRAAIVRLAGPMMAASLLTAVAQLTVLAMVGHLGDRALYVRAAYTPVMFVFLALGEGVAAATQVATALSRGRRDDGAGLHASLQIAAAVALAALVLAAACWVLAPELARFVGVPAGTAGPFATFVRWTSAASVLALGPVVAAAALRGFGRVRAAAGVTVTYIVVDLAVVAVAGFVGHRGALSLAWGLALGSVVAGVLGAGLLVRHARPARAPLRDQLDLLRTVSLPILGSYVALFAYGLTVIRVLRGFGPAVVSGFSVGYSILALAIVPAIAFGSATAIHLNQLRGADELEAAPATLRDALGLVVRLYAGVALVLTALSWLAPWAISADPSVVAATHRYLLIVGPSALALGPVIVTLTLLEQTGAGGRALALNAANVPLVGAIGALATARLDTPDAMYWTMALTALAGAPAVVAVGLRHMRRLARGPGEPRHIPLSPELRGAVHALFGAPGFRFKTYLPALAGPREIDALLTDDTRAIALGDRIIGLAELESVAVNAGHYRLHFRLQDGVGEGRWAAILNDLLVAERDARELLRVTFLVSDDDQRARSAAERCGFVNEGMLPGMLEQHGVRHGVHYYARVWSPA